MLKRIFLVASGLTLVAMLAGGCALLAATRSRAEIPSNLFGSADGELATLWWAFPSIQYDLVRVERSISGTDSWVEIGTVPVSQSQFIDKQLSCGLTYQYRLRGFDTDKGKFSEYSPSATVITAACEVVSTPTLEPTQTPTPTEEPCIDSVKFIADVTIPDGTELRAGSQFTKTWRVLNDGTCTWTTEYTLMFAGGNRMDGPVSIAMPRTVGAGEEVELSAALVAPVGSGRQRGEWQMRNAMSVVFGRRLWVEIFVPGQPTSTPQPTRTPIPTTPPPKPATATPKPPTATPKPPTATPGPTIIEWKGEYFDNRNLSGTPAIVRNDKMVVFNWKTASPDPKLPVDDFSARWTRTLTFGAGVYRFKATVDDGVRVWVDNALIIDEWHDSKPHTYSTDFAVTGGSHTIKVEYFEHGGDASINFSWALVTEASYPDWKGEYFNNRNLSGSPVITRNDKSIDFNWGTAAPANGLPTDGFSVRWTRTMKFDEGKYRFYAKVDDGVRIWVDGKLVVDEWTDGSVRQVSDTVKLSKGKHTVQVGYYDLVDKARIKVWWELVTPPTPTPTATPTTPAPASVGGQAWADYCALTGEDPATAVGDPTGCVTGSDGLYRANGLLDAGETGLVGLEVELRSGTCGASVQATVTTDTNSKYKFDGLSEGTYCVTISTAAPNDAILGTGLWTIPSDSGTVVVVVTAGSMVTTIDFAWDIIP